MKFLLINGAKAYAHSQGRYNQTLQAVAQQTLTELGHEVTETVIDDGYTIATELDRWEAADVVIYQMPAWWMGAPWLVKKYIDEVLTEGHGRLYANDGRTRTDPSKTYGSGGLLQGKQVMLSVTWNAPAEAFTDPKQLFEGQGVEGVYLHFHKIHAFIGMRSLPVFACYDVMKSPQAAKDRVRYAAHLRTHFS